MIGRVLVLVGSLLILLAAVGVVRFDDVYARLHALAKASTIGMLTVLAGAATTLTHLNDVTSAVLAALLQLVTSPVAANAVSTATYMREGWQPGRAGGESSDESGDPSSAALAPDGQD